MTALSTSNGRSPNGHLREPDAFWLPVAGPWPDVAPDDVEVERARLEAEIAMVTERAATARRRAADADADVAAVLRAEIVAVQAQLVEMEQQHEAQVAQIRGAARADVARILATARQQAASQRQTVTPADGTLTAESPPPSAEQVGDVE